jgi:hypothetical protein
VALLKNKTYKNKSKHNRNKPIKYIQLIRKKNIHYNKNSKKIGKTRRSGGKKQKRQNYEKTSSNYLVFMKDELIGGSASAFQLHHLYSYFYLLPFVLGLQRERRRQR